MRGRLIQTSTTFQKGSSEEYHDFSSKEPSLRVDDYSDIPIAILNCLYFRQITDRIEDVAQAHEETFGWVYQSSATAAVHKLWDSLVDWLECGSGYYWINGKAGSGKSTLMKYICNNPATKRALSDWAGSDTLITASFFFWNLGSSLQKSQEGLLRSLLHDVLDRHQYLIPILFPGLCRAILADREIDLSAPSFAELRKAFSNLVSHKSTTKICFFIDGVDEYNGDHSQILDLFAELASSSRVKLVLSSRPINPCIAAFSRCPTLRLQDLTYDDIRRYVEINLGAHPNMRKLMDREGPEASELLSEISHKASGVFLWVRLAVKSLLEGLQNYDRISDLWLRLNQLPADLEQLYQHMLDTMLPLYQQQASQFFQIVLRSTEVQEEHPLTLLQLSYAEEPDPMAVLTSRTGELSQSEISARCEATEGRVRSRCCGLVEVQDIGSISRLKKDSSKSSRYEATDGHRHSARVGFLHKTVAEFLHIDKVWADIVSLTDNTSFDCNIALLSSCLHEAKRSCVSTDWAKVERVWLQYCLVYARLAEDTSMTPQTALLDEFDRTMQLAHSRRKDNPTNRELGMLSWTHRLTGFSTFLALTVQHGLVLYLSQKVEEDVTIITSGDGTIMLHQALRQFLHGDNRIPRRNFAEILMCLVKQGVGPNKSKDWADENVRTPWEMLLDEAVRLTQHRNDFYANLEKGGDSKLFADLLQQFVVSGADVNTYCTSKICVSALAVLQKLFEPPSKLPLTFGRRSPGDLALIKSTWEDIRNLMIERGARSREWVRDEGRFERNKDKPLNETAAFANMERINVLKAPKVVQEAYSLETAKGTLLPELNPAKRSNKSWMGLPSFSETCSSMYKMLLGFNLPYTAGDVTKEQQEDPEVKRNE
jgi:hypothetical protein